MTLYLDTETYNTQSPRDLGTYEYARTSEVLLFSYTFNDSDPVLWDVTNGDPMPKDLRRALQDGEGEIVAHNSMFDRNVIKHAFGLDTDLTRWHCTMARAMAHGFPGGLGQLSSIFGLGEGQAKLDDGKKLINRFCSPAPKNHKADRYDRTTHPDEWARFCEYALQDIVAMREIYRRLPSWNYKGEGLAVHHLDQAMNDRGFAVDGELVAAGAQAAVDEKEALFTRFRELTNGAVEKPTQRAQFLAYLNDSYDLGIADTQKTTLESVLKRGDLWPELSELITISINANKTSTAKYAALGPATSPDGRFRGGLQFSGAARTRRWAGRTFQPQNLPSRGLPPSTRKEALKDAKKSGKPPKPSVDLYIGALKSGVADLLFEDRMLFGSAALRGVLVAPKGRKLVVSDLSNIEGRANAWLANERWKLDAFAAYDRSEGPDLYNVTAGSLLGKEPDDISKTERNVMGKVPELALGYQGGVGAFQTFAKVYGVKMMDHWGTIQANLDPRFVSGAKANWTKWGEERNEEQDEPIDPIEWLASESVKLAWRDRHPAIRQLWYDCENAARDAISRPGQRFRAGKHLVFKAFGFKGFNYLLMGLPSGNFLVYFDPKISRRDDTVTYMQVDPITRQWGRAHTYGGKLVENACQSLSRDILAENMLAIERSGAYQIVLTVHDEVVTEAIDDRSFNADDLSLRLATNPPWLHDFPLAAAGFEGHRYRKD
ncbi:MAG: DNA polymerase I [Pseudomonadota bacterium]